MRNDDFAQDVIRGLTATPKYIPSKYIYDEEGTRLFDLLTQTEDYYLTSCDKEILRTHAEGMSKIIGTAPFRLIELGPGNAEKVSLLIEGWQGSKLSFYYVPIDISPRAIEDVTRELQLKFPSLHIESYVEDFFSALQKLGKNTETRNILLFLGSNIGNFTPKEAKDFLKRIHTFLNSGDLFLVGFDFKKDPNLIRRAYNDSKGITKAFNLNVLTRINRELSANFDLDKFDHGAIYDAKEGVNESFVISLETQDVLISSLSMTISFQKGEKIKSGFSYKFSLEDIDNLSKKSGYRVIQTFQDSKKYFGESLWEVA